MTDQNLSMTFIDADSGDEAYASVRVAGTAVGVALSLRANGDVEVFMDGDEAERLASALTAAASSLPGDAGQAP